MAAGVAAGERAVGGVAAWVEVAGAEGCRYRGESEALGRLLGIGGAETR